MRRFFAIVNLQTLIVICLSFVSCWLTIRYQFTLYLDFLIMGLLIAFPLTLTTKEAFKRRERAIQYLSLFKASLQSVYYTIQNSKLEPAKKEAFKNTATGLTGTLIGYLSAKKPEDASKVQHASDEIAAFIINNKKDLKGSLSSKILLFIFRMNESVEFLLATKRHHTPKGLHVIVLVAIYLFVIFYPASLLNRIGATESLGYLFMASVLKSLFLISLYNVQEMLEDPFNPLSPDGIRIQDFIFTAQVMPLKEDETETGKKDSGEGESD